MPKAVRPVLVLLLAPVLAFFLMPACTHPAKVAATVQVTEAPRAPSASTPVFAASGLPLNADVRKKFEDEMSSLVDKDLKALREEEQKKVGASGIEALNEQTLALMDRYTPPPAENARFDKVDFTVAEAMLRSSKVHPVIGDFYYRLYNAQAAEKRSDIGFCFGRATYMHHMLGRLGVSQGSMRKIWIVGALKLWKFHVATMVYTNAGWMVIDPHAIGGKPLPPRDWFSQFKLLNVLNSNKKARVYFTEAQKFAALPGAYDPVQMGILTWRNNERVETSREEDWYQHYFVDMRNHDTKKENQLRLGLTPLVPSATDPKVGVLNSTELATVTNPYRLDDQVQAYQQSSAEVQRYIIEEYDKKNNEHYRY